MRPKETHHDQGGSRAAGSDSDQWAAHEPMTFLCKAEAQGKEGGRSNWVALLRLFKKPTGHSTVENLGFPAVLWLMGQIPWYLSFLFTLCHKLGCYSSNIHCLPRPFTPEWYWAWPDYVGWPTECGLKWSMPLPSGDLTSYKGIPPVTLGVANNAMTRTGPRNWLVQEEEETWEQTRRQSSAWSSTVPAHLWEDWRAGNKHLLLPATGIVVGC